MLPGVICSGGSNPMQPRFLGKIGIKNKWVNKYYFITKYADKSIGQQVAVFIRCVALVNSAAADLYWIEDDVVTDHPPARILRWTWHKTNSKVFTHHSSLCRDLSIDTHLLSMGSPFISHWMLGLGFPLARHFNCPFSLGARTRLDGSPNQ